MKKAFIRKALALTGCVAFTFAACVLYCAYLDVLAGASLLAALCCSVLWNDNEQLNTNEK